MMPLTEKTNYTLNMAYPFDADLTTLETKDTYTYTQNIRVNSRKEKIGTGFRLVLAKPDVLKELPLSTSTSPIKSDLFNKLYLNGATDVVNKILKKYLADNTTNNTCPQEGLPIPVDTLVSEQAIITHLAAIGTKLLTKQSIQEAFESLISKNLTAMLVAKGITEEAVIEKTKEAYCKFLSDLAAPATKYNDEVAKKLLDVLDLAETETPVILTLKSKLEKSPDTNLADLLI